MSFGPCALLSPLDCSIVLLVSLYQFRNLLLSDSQLDDDILMEVPELYRYGREGHWFGNKVFLMFVLDAVIQVSIDLLAFLRMFVLTLFQSAIIFFILNYSYFSPTARPDGYDIAQYEYATVGTVYLISFHKINFAI